tara:strand:- start:2143 stop:3165 length:1023 start_codon:yes stop_codon:yes gene_type:complete
MALQASGTITLAQIQTEFGGSNPISLSEYYRGGSLVGNTSANASVPTSGAINMANFYSASAAVAADGIFTDFANLSATNQTQTTQVYSRYSRLLVAGDGSRVYFIPTQGQYSGDGTVYLYTMSTAGDWSTRSYTGTASLPVSDTTAISKWSNEWSFNGDGTKLFVGESVKANMFGMAQSWAVVYTLSTAYDISTASQHSKLQNGWQQFGFYSALDADGDFYTQVQANYLVRFDFGTANDATTINTSYSSWNNTVFAMGSQNPKNHIWSQDGLTMLQLGSTGLQKHTVTTAFTGTGLTGNTASISHGLTESTMMVPLTSANNSFLMLWTNASSASYITEWT